MKKRYFHTAIIFLFSLFLTLIPAENKADDSQSLTTDYLTSGNWGPENILGMKIKFTRDGRFESEINYGQSYNDTAGTYSIKNGKLTLVIENSAMDSSLAGFILKNGTLINDPSSPKYRQYISYKGKELEQLYIKGELKIWNYNTLVKEGEPLKINGREAIAMGAKEGLTTAVLKMREAPSSTAKEIHYTYVDVDQTFTVKALPKDRSLIILARTKDKDKVGKYNNYWYYVEFERYFDYMRAWVYGEFVKIK
ncbi:MAG TPA: hypothetical protein PK293_13620 [Spirochaetota bacterium]|nr:hypothetical protein [Spirochaetota bacterium]HPF07071.1 hypothetical protein [Spirochaetota bacterium]